MRDLSEFEVSVAPSEFASWGDARAQLMLEGKRALKTQLSAELSAADEADKADIRKAFSARELALENDIDNKPFHFDALFTVKYNFLSQ